MLPYKTLRLDGNPLDVLADSAAKSVIVAIDCAHQPGSTSQLRSDLNPAVEPLQMFPIENTEWAKSPIRFNIETNRGDLSDLLYPLENLRKIGAEE